MSHILLHGSALDHLTRLPRASVDCVVTDPPYGETSLPWDRRCKGWMREVRGVLKSHGSVWVFGSFRYFFECSEEFSGWRIAQEIVWEKHNGSNSFNDRFRRVHELAVHFYPEEVPWSAIYKNPLTSDDATARTVRRKARPQQWGELGGSTYESYDGGRRLLRSILYHPSEHGKAIHPTQKPVAICEVLLAYSGRPGGTVLDPFCGSASTGLAAQRRGMDFIGIDVDIEHLGNAETRLAGIGLFREDETA